MLHFAWILDGIPRNSAPQWNSKDTTNAREKGQHVIIFHQQGGICTTVSVRFPLDAFQLPASCADACLTIPRVLLPWYYYCPAIPASSTQKTKRKTCLAAGGRLPKARRERFFQSFNRPPVLKKRAKRSERSGTWGRLSSQTGTRHQWGQYRLQNQAALFWLL